MRIFERFFFIYFRERQRAITSGRGRGRERIPSRLPAELGAGWGSLISGA